MNINDIHDKYVLHIKMDFNKLRNNGFKIYGDHAYFNKFVYKDIDRLTVDIDLSDNTYTLTVTDMDHDEIYFPIYNWDCGKNYELEEVIENVIATLDFLHIRESVKTPIIIYLITLTPTTIFTCIATTFKN